MLTLTKATEITTCCNYVVISRELKNYCEIYSVISKLRNKITDMLFVFAFLRYFQLMGFLNMARVSFKHLLTFNRLKSVFGYFCFLIPAITRIPNSIDG